MTCKDVQELLPDIINNPGMYPDAEAHIKNCAECADEKAFLQELREGIKVTMPDPAITETVGQKIRVARRVRREQVRRPLIYAASMAAILALTLLMPGVLDSLRGPVFYAEYEAETEATLMSLDIEAGWQISTDEIAMYLLENADLETIKELGLDKEQVQS